MRRIMQRNQVVITALAVMLAVAGYLTYAGKQDLENLNQAQSGLVSESGPDYDTYVAGTGESQTENVQADAQTGTDTAVQENAASNETDAERAAVSAADAVQEDIDSLDCDIDAEKAEVLANGMAVGDYLAAAKLSREQVRGKNREDLLKVIDNEESDEQTRQAAVNKMVELADNSDKECAAETLLGAKGFENSMVSITDGKADVVICRNELSDAELAQIEDIVKRKTEIPVTDIVISLLNVSS